MKSLVVCVEFDDFLNLTLPRNRHHFDMTMVVTSLSDVNTQKVAWKNGCSLFLTDAFYENQTHFNKGLAIERALDVLGRDGWICIWDADIVMPRNINILYDPKCLYTALRRTLPSSYEFSDELDWRKIPLSGLDNEYPGYFQLFHAKAVGPKPWYSTDWVHAGGCDSDFSGRFPTDKRKHPPFHVLHLGPSVDQVRDMSNRVGENWCGRVTPRIDGKPLPKESTSNRQQVDSLICARRANKGVCKEHV